MVEINGVPTEAFVDFGSEVTLIKESLARSLELVHDSTSTIMKGFGNQCVQSLGNLKVVLVSMFQVVIRREFTLCLISINIVSLLVLKT